jgi:hypothetical protein
MPLPTHPSDSLSCACGTQGMMEIPQRIFNKLRVEPRYFRGRSGRTTHKTGTSVPAWPFGPVSVSVEKLSQAALVGCLCLLLHQRSVWLHLSRQAGHLRIPIEAQSGSLALRLTGSPPDSPVPLLKPTLVWLHVEQAIYIVNSFQFTRSARLILVTDRQGAGFDTGC